ncbi:MULTISPECIES: hypothetical protein [unclassified Micromonospora]|uniref:hypothetical protein n=1 Tax=unclassified Micromonospora TaxID=2617518 RepID=UPI001034AA44|nr:MULTISPECIES: hypothetical protein [unclassified Micromonospora]QKW14082.1 hypothetical protein HUT12_15650 [Verrucosispora sp. NA02020]TBL38896.1 hypothetical protein EYA84_08970 [Verrucosispora sp. SN26_14.1]
MRVPATAASMGVRTDRRPSASPVRPSDTAVVVDRADRMERLLSTMIDEVGGAEPVVDQRTGEAATSPFDLADESVGVDPAAALLAAFDLAYRDLPARGQRLVRYLGLHPGPDFDADAAAALCNLTLVQVRRGLGELRERRLLVRCGSRYRFPDRVVDHVRRLALTESAVDRDAALARLGDARPGTTARGGTAARR